MIEVFIEELDLAALGFSGVTPAATGRPGYHPSTLLKIYLYGCLNRLQSSRRLEREAPRDIELMWLLGRLAPDFKTIALVSNVAPARIDFRRTRACDWRSPRGMTLAIAPPPALDLGAQFQICFIGHSGLCDGSITRWNSWSG